MVAKGKTQMEILDNLLYTFGDQMDEETIDYLLKRKKEIEMRDIKHGDSLYFIRAKNDIIKAIRDYKEWTTVTELIENYKLPYTVHSVTQFLTKMRNNGEVIRKKIKGRYRYKAVQIEELNG